MKFGRRRFCGTIETGVGSKARGRVGSIISIEDLRSVTVQRWSHAREAMKKKQTRTSFYILFSFSVAKICPCMHSDLNYVWT